ncbi:DUF4402 domain-containing protein [Pelomonas sp. V22]|uniref:DUF4402 domain-containing protein n=1 Tax=Pelomonas sp. V22 TaxID=2822139 RepID=UPI0024A95450|nr:DUF4402 domain-containing protein [Pelomonas sp. V22]MDI4631618.1 DUF4402 domain-containing protein [Pelomonas sp. V22]
MKMLQQRPLLRRTAAALLASLGGLTAIPAGAADNATASATAVVLIPIAVSKFADMVFGNLVAGNDDVTISTSGARTKSGTTGLPSGGSAPAAARFDVTGSGAATFSIDYTGSDSVLTSGSDTMAIAWISEAVATSGGATGKTTTTTDATGTLSSGAAYIFVGAKLTVGSTQPAGTYTGSVKVTVAYN